MGENNIGLTEKNAEETNTVLIWQCFLYTNMKFESSSTSIYMLGNPEMLVFHWIIDCCYISFCFSGVLNYSLKLAVETSKALLSVREVLNSQRGWQRTLG